MVRVPGKKSRSINKRDPQTNKTQKKAKKRKQQLKNNLVISSDSMGMEPSLPKRRKKTPEESSDSPDTQPR